MKEVILKTTAGDLTYVSNQKGGFTTYRFGEATLNGKKFNVALQDNKYCGHTTMVGDEIIDYMKKSDIKFVSEMPNAHYLELFLFVNTR